MGAAQGGWLGPITAVTLTVLSPPIWHDVLGDQAGILPYTAPALFSMPLAFIACYVVSIMDRSAQSALRRRGSKRNTSDRKPALGRGAPPRTDPCGRGR